MPYDIALMYRVAEMYFKDELKQESIGRRLDMSKYKVSRIIRKAKEEGVVQISIIKPKDSNKRLK